VTNKEDRPVQSAKLILEELADKFPKINFTANIDIGTYFKDNKDWRKKKRTVGNERLFISWDNGPQQTRIEDVISKYRYGVNDDKKKKYNYSNIVDGLEQTRFIYAHRTITRDIISKAFRVAKKKHKDFKGKIINSLDDVVWQCADGHLTAGETIQFHLADFDLTDGFKAKFFDEVEQHDK